jgi:hypothetical protein
VICRNKEKERDKPIPTGFDFGNRPLFSKLARPYPARDWNLSPA